MADTKDWKRLQEVPDWRWLRAVECVDRKVKPHYSIDDKHVRRAYKYKMKYDKFNMRKVDEASERWPDIFDAEKLHANTNGSGLRWIVEAAIVADRDPQEIGDYIAVDPRTIETYEQLFFDVRHLLKNRGWVHGAIIYPAHKHGVSNTNPDQLWKVLAFVLDWEIVKAFWDFGSVPVPQLNRINSALRGKVSMNGLMAALQTKTNQFNALDITEQAVELIKHDETTGSMLAKDQNQSAFSQMLHSIEIRMISAHEQVSRFEPRRQSVLPPPDVFEANRRQLAEEEVQQLEDAKLEGVPDGELGKEG